MKKIGICDTTFARADMGKLAKRTLIESSEKINVIRKTVPGVKDLPLAAKKLFEEENCDLVLVVGMPGAKPIDKQCSHEASLGLIQTQLLTNKPIIEVFVHEGEGRNDKELREIAKDRTKKHCINALNLLFNQRVLQKNAGRGLRQGSRNAPTFEL